MLRRNKRWISIFLSMNLLFGTIVTTMLPVTHVLAQTQLGVDSQKGFVSNADLDKRVIFQSFSLYQPYESNMYNIFSKNSTLLKKWGVTDIWMPPAYRAFSQSYYGEGYAIADRYDLGEFPQGLNGQKATKYGTSDELKKLISALHNQGMSVQEDLVPNQMLGLSKPEIVNITSVDNYGTSNDSSVVNKLAEVYSRGGGEGQQKYGLIKEWNHSYFNGTSTQALGMNRVMVDETGKPYRYFGANDPNNYLPDWLANSDAQKYGKINTIDNYLTVDGYYAVKGADTINDQVWRPLLLNYVDPQSGATKESYLDYMKANGFDGASDSDVRQKIIDGDSNVVNQLTDSYISAQPGYSSASDPHGNMRFDKDDNSNVNKNVLQYEFLIGTDIDNSNPTVQEEQLNWAKFLLDEYKFDGFRIDAASHYNIQILTNLAELMSSRYGKDLNNHLSYIESYTDNQVDFENSNNNGQLVYDHKLFGVMKDTLSSASSWRPLSDIVSSSYVNRNMSGEKAIPNWSFVNNHDQEHNVLHVIPLTDEEANGTKPGTREYEELQFKKYYDDMAKTDKQYAPYNVPSKYAYILTNKDTVPAVYYGDLFKANDSYMSTKTIYHDTIVKLLEARNKYVSGDQKITYYSSNTSSTPGYDLLASVRYGTSRKTGAATVISNNPNTKTTINVDMGKEHANQTFVDATGFNSDELATDGNGILTVTVNGVSNPLVHGYLGVWVPKNDGYNGNNGNNSKNGNNGTNNIGNNTINSNNSDTGHQWQQKQEPKQWQQWIQRKQP